MKLSLDHHHSRYIALSLSYQRLREKQWPFICRLIGFESFRMELILSIMSQLSRMTAQQIIYVNFLDLWLG